MGGVLGRACDRGGTSGGGVMTSVRPSKYSTKNKREGDGAMTIGGRRLIGGHINQPNIGVRDGGDIREGIRPWWNVCEGHFAVVRGGKLSGKKKQKNIRRGLNGRKAT